MAELFDMAKQSSVFRACVGSLPLDAGLQNSEVPESFGVKWVATNICWSLIEVGLYSVDAHTMKPITITHTSDDEAIRDAAQSSLLSPINASPWWKPPSQGHT